MLVVVAYFRERNLVGAEGALHREAVDLLGTCPALRRAKNDHRPARPVCEASRAGVDLDAPDVAEDFVEDGCHPLVHVARLVTFDEPRRIAVADQELLELLPRNAPEDGGTGDL